MEYTVHEGRPDNCQDRLPKEIRSYDLLDSLNIKYQRIDHEPMYTVEMCHDVDRLLNISICKNLFLCNSQETAFYLLLMPGQKRFQAGVLSRQLGISRLSFANEKYMEDYLDITPGSVSVLGLMNDKEHHVKLLIDSEILKHDRFGCHPCINTSSLEFATTDLMDKIVPEMEHEPTIVEL